MFANKVTLLRRNMSLMVAVNGVGVGISYSFLFLFICEPCILDAPYPVTQLSLALNTTNRHDVTALDNPLSLFIYLFITLSFCCSHSLSFLLSSFSLCLSVCLSGPKYYKQTRCHRFR